MKTRTIFAALAVPATAMGLLAQETVNAMRAQKIADEGVVLAQGGGFVGLSGEPGNVRFFTQEFSFNGRPVTGAPYSADEKTESVQTLADGTHITNTTTTRVYRDSQGRTRREMSLPIFGGETQPHTMITISDPVAGMSYMLDSENKTARKMPTLPALAEAKMKAEALAREAHLENQFKEPNLAVQARADGEAAIVSSKVRIERGAFPPSKHEDLGNIVIEGVNAKGSRETSTIEAGAMGNDRAIAISSERWYSPDLQIEVKSVRNDPRSGETTHTVTNINRTEPDPSLFQVPADYHVDEDKPGPQIRKFEFHP